MGYVPVAKRSPIQREWQFPKRGLAIAVISLVVRERCGHGSRWRVETFVSEINAFLAAVEADQPVAEARDRGGLPIRSS